MGLTSIYLKGWKHLRSEKRKIEADVAETSGKYFWLSTKNKCTFTLCMLMLQLWKDAMILALLLRINFQKPHNYVCIKEHFFLITPSHAWWRKYCFWVKFLKLKFWLKYMFSSLPNKKVTYLADTGCLVFRLN